MFQYFLKVVSTQFQSLDRQLVNSHQYSVTHFERDLTTGHGGSTEQGIQVQHGGSGIPGAFIYLRKPIFNVLTFVVCRCILQL
jgi:endoplasmic reticulum-Golgi intermediate compartment protein 3